MREASRSVKASASRGKGVGSALLYAAPCRLYVSRLYPNEFALSYGEGSLLLMQAATGGDAQQWLVSLASCLFFSSAAFEAVLAECAAFFEAAPKTLPDRLSLIEALDALRTMFGKVRRDGTRLGTAHGLVALTARSPPRSAQVPKPKKVIVTRWGDDEYAYGSYSHIQVGASGRDYCIAIRFFDLFRFHIASIDS